MRHYIPTFRQYGERRYARPQDAYDVMRVRDSWLCAQLADEILTQHQAAIHRGHAGWRLPTDSCYRMWQSTFDGMMRKLGGDSWAASIGFHLTKREN